jgi:hypothetical protein
MKEEYAKRVESSWLELFGTSGKKVGHPVNLWKEGDSSKERERKSVGSNDWVEKRVTFEVAKCWLESEKTLTSNHDFDTTRNDSSVVWLFFQFEIENGFWIWDGAIETISQLS